MKRIATLYFALMLALGSFAQTTENFNSRSAASLTQLKAYLQSRCWQFTDFDVNSGSVLPIEGDGSMVSGPAATAGSTGIYTPTLSLSGSSTVSFQYKLSAAVTATNQRWIRLLLTDAANNIVFTVDNFDLNGKAANTVYTYSKNFSQGGSGCFKVYINYQGNGGDNRIAIDGLSVNATPCPGACNQPPIANNDFVGGALDHTASGNVLPNDQDPDNGVLTTTLVTNSADGNVVLTSFGTFTFTPNPGFKGSSTTFTYIACDNGTPSLCSNVATVTITFPTQGALPVNLTDFGAVYNNDKVNLKWTTAQEINNDHFDIERSTDGATFNSVGTVKGQGTSSLKTSYEFNDDVSRSVLNKNDLYYRLKQVDLNGKATYSKVLVVRVYRTRTLQSLSVTPNPAINDIKVNVQLNENAFIVMKVVNSNGAEVLRNTTRGTTGTNSLTLNGTGTLQTGIYFLEVIVNSNERMMVKLIKN